MIRPPYSAIAAGPSPPFSFCFGLAGWLLPTSTCSFRCCRWCCCLLLCCAAAAAAAAAAVAAVCAGASFLLSCCCSAGLDACSCSERVGSAHNIAAPGDMFPEQICLVHFLKMVKWSQQTEPSEIPNIMATTHALLHPGPRILLANLDELVCLYVYCGYPEPAATARQAQFHDMFMYAGLSRS